MAERSPSVHVVGTAEREVVPDRAVVTVVIRTPVLRTAAEALALGVEAFAIGRDLRRATDRALEQEAVRDALERGRALAEAAGMRCGEVLAIGEPPRAGGDEPIRLMERTPGIGAGAGDLEEALGELVPQARTLAASVRVSLALLPPG